jgi:DNA adenine methylase
MSRQPKIKRPVLRYHGGKFLLAKWIISHFPKHRTYVECFGGGGSVLMQKPRSYAEIYNDKWDTVVNVFEVLRNPITAKELERIIRLTPFSRTEFNKCGEIELAKVTDPIEKARRTILRSFAGFGSASTNAKYSTGFRANSNRSGTTPAHDWVNYSDNITSFVERLKGVVIENKDYRDVIAQHDSSETLIYLDPPYVHSTRNMLRGNATYAWEMTDQDHIEMAEILSKVKGMAIISGYDCELYKSLFSDWLKIQRKTFGDGAVERTECLWLNDRAGKNLNRQLF